MDKMNAQEEKSLFESFRNCPRVDLHFQSGLVSGKPMGIEFDSRIVDKGSVLLGINPVVLHHYNIEAEIEGFIMTLHLPIDCQFETVHRGSQCLSVIARIPYDFDDCIVKQEIRA